MCCLYKNQQQYVNKGKRVDFLHECINRTNETNYALSLISKRAKKNQWNRTKTKPRIRIS